MSELNFPTSPSDGDTYLSYEYSDARGTWELQEQSSIARVGDVLVSSPADRDMLYYDSNSSLWSNTPEQAIPAGVIISYSGDATPGGYFRCDGSTRLQAEYPSLYAVIGSTYNDGRESVGEFRLPSLSGRIPVGKDSSQPTEFLPVGKYAGTMSHTLSIDEMPSHTHTQNAHTHTQDSHSHTQDSHSHGAGTPFSNTGGSFGLGYFGSFRGRVGVTGGWGLGTDGRQPGISSNAATNQGTVAINSATGGSQPHNNVQPYITLDYLIKY